MIGIVDSLPEMGVTEFEPFYRLAVAAAIGLTVGVERHWREREAASGQRTAGIRTFALIGMLGGAAGLIEAALPAGGPPGLVVASIFLAFAGIFAFYKWREEQAESDFSVTTVVAAMLTYLFGVLAVVGDLRLAAAGAVGLTAILASREPLHRFIEQLSWVELRSAIILLAMSFVILPLLPEAPYGPFGGVSLRSVWSLAILLAAISYVGYVAVRLFGAGRGELAAGAAGGLVSSTAVTLDNARRVAAGGDADRLAAGAAAAGCVSYLRSAVLAVGLAPALAGFLLPPLLLGALVMASAALWLVRGRLASAHELGRLDNPFELAGVLKVVLFLTAIGFAVRAASSVFGSAGIVSVSALAGIGDVDAAIVTVAKLPNLDTGIAALAIALTVAVNTIAKAVYALVVGRGRFGRLFGGVSAITLLVATAAFLLARAVAG
ncbi:MgtC/SapB family protein [Kaistia sp. MMO-174]|uniref:MgtC/SapB family protein n=1 Tax=Kaistia sp. MMO-174 TaxID=3081256 RepID=UPI001AC141F2|nr:MgtC/SapB family protein [Hyphomicrobiales bacterium]